ncbi:hypothetical protein D3C74_289530 [compost metagenome]
MVAAWMRAETGVGPAMASPSQAWSGNWADLPHAATRSARPIAVSRAVPAAGASAKTVAKSTAPKPANMSMSATIRPRSPTRFMMNAFLAATALARSWFQNPMSRYEASPTPSQPTNSSR